jgi:hypothetical protein
LSCASSARLAGTLRDAKAKYNDIIWWRKGSAWKNQSFTVNTTVRYIYFFCNTREDGPVVVDLPQAATGASFYGTIEDAWFFPLVDIGFEGKGGKYLVLPPDYTRDVPAGYIPVRPTTYNTMNLLRSIVASRSEQDVRAGDAAGKIEKGKDFKPDAATTAQLKEAVTEAYWWMTHKTIRFYRLAPLTPPPS